MNNNNETFSYMNNDIDFSSSDYNNYNSYMNKNYAYNTLNANNFPKFKSKYIYNLNSFNIKP